MSLKNCFTVFFILSFFAASAQKPDFSGTWALDTQMTVFGKTPKWVMPSKLAVSQSPEQFTVVRNNPDEKFAETTDTIQRTFDRTENRTEPNGVRKKSLLKWSGDGQAAIFTESMTIANMDVGTLTESWSLTNAGKTLIADRSVVYENGFSYTIRAFYHKHN